MSGRPATVRAAHEPDLRSTERRAETADVEAHAPRELYRPAESLISYAATRNQLQCRNTVIPAN